MTYIGSSHGWWCNARTYPTECKYCGAQVYYFTCDCGSKVFFDDLGQPWPIHNCAQYIQSQVEIAIQEKYTRQVKERRSWQPPIVRCKAEHSQIVEEIGVIREIVKPVDVYSKFDIPKAGSPSTNIEIALSDFAHPYLGFICRNSPDVGVNRSRCRILYPGTDSL